MGGRVRPELFEHIVHKNIFYALYDSVKRGIQPTHAELLSELEDEEARSEAARLAQMPIVADDPLLFMQDCLTSMRLSQLERRRNALKKELRTAQGDRKRQLLAEIGELNKELKQQ